MPSLVPCLHGLPGREGPPSPSYRGTAALCPDANLTRDLSEAGSTGILAEVLRNGGRPEVSRQPQLATDTSGGETSLHLLDLAASFVAKVDVRVAHDERKTQDVIIGARRTYVTPDFLWDHPKRSAVREDPGLNERWEHRRLEGALTLDLLSLNRLSNKRSLENLLVLGEVLADLAGEDLGRCHSLVEELYDRPQRRRDLVRDKDETDPTCAEILFRPLKELYGVFSLVLKLNQDGAKLETVAFAARLQQPFEELSAPLECSIGCVVKHLRDDLTPAFAVGAALGFNEGRQGVLIEKEVVEAESGDGDLTLDEQEAARVSIGTWAERFARQQLRMLGEEPLQVVLGFVGLLDQGKDLLAVTNEEAADAWHRQIVSEAMAVELCLLPLPAPLPSQLGTGRQRVKVDLGEPARHVTAARRALNRLDGVSSLGRLRARRRWPIARITAAWAERWVAREERDLAVLGRRVTTVGRLGERERGGEKALLPAVRLDGHLPLELLESLIHLVRQLVVAQPVNGVGNDYDAFEAGGEVVKGSPAAPEVSRR